MIFCINFQSVVSSFLKSLILVLACCGTREGNMHVSYSSPLTISVPCQLRSPPPPLHFFSIWCWYDHVTSTSTYKMEIHVTHQYIYKSLSNYYARGTQGYRGLQMAVQKVVKLCIKSCHVSSSGYGICQSSRRSCHLVLVMYRFHMEI